MKTLTERAIELFELKYYYARHLLFRPSKKNWFNYYLREKRLNERLNNER